MKSLEKENSMKEFCLFLEDDPLVEVERCAVGVNFLNVWIKNSVPDLFKNIFRDLPVCSTVELFTYLNNFPEASFFDIGFACLENDLLPEAY